MHVSIVTNIISINRHSIIYQLGIMTYGIYDLIPYEFYIIDYFSINVI